MEAKQVQQQFSLSVIMAALFAFPERDRILNAPCQPANLYEVGEQAQDDARIVPTALNYVYNAVKFAGIREANPRSTVFDQSTRDEVEESPYDGGSSEFVTDIEQMSYAQGQEHAAAVFAWADHLNNIPMCQSLLGWTKKEVVKDEAGLEQAQYSSVRLVRSYKDWIADNKARTPADSPFYVSIIESIQYGLDVPLYKHGINEALSHVKQWLAEVPWAPENSKNFGLTRCERIVGHAADNKWKQFVRGLCLNNPQDVLSAMKAWNLMVYSPLMASQTKAIRESDDYQLMVADEQIAKQEKLLAKIEKAEYHEKLKQGIAERQAKLDERMAAILGKQKPETHDDKVAPLARPNVINSR